MLLSNINFEDRISVPTKRIMTDNGQMIVPCAFARTGVQLYTAKQLGLVDEDPNKIIEVHRSEKEVFDDASMDSFRSVPVTIGHPKKDGKPMPVTVDNSAELQVGMLEGRPHRFEDTLSGVLVLSDKVALDEVDDGMVELSAGYTCDIQVTDGKYEQVKIRANHIAIVKHGRAGSSCRISDEALIVIDEMDDENKAKHVVVEDKELDAILVMAKHMSDSAVTFVAVSKELEDSKESLAKLEKEIEGHKAIVDSKDEAIAKAAKVNQENIEERCTVLDQARFLADLKGFEGKSLTEIKTEVISALMPELKLDGKTEEYVNVRYDIAVEDAEKETPMGRELKKHLSKPLVADEKPVNKVEQARLDSMARNAA